MYKLIVKEAECILRLNETSFTFQLIVRMFLGDEVLLAKLQSDHLVSCPGDSYP